MQAFVSLYLPNLLDKKALALDNTAYQAKNQTERQVEPKIYEIKSSKGQKSIPE